LQHLQSVKCNEPGDKLNTKFWQEAGPIVSVLMRIKVMTVREFRGEQHELAFLQYFYENARVLKYASVVAANARVTGISDKQMFSILQNMNDARWASKFGLAIMGSNGPEGGRPWMFERGSNFSDDDPFAPVKFLEHGQYSFPSRLYACLDFIHVNVFLNCVLVAFFILSIM
jgi:hypothetical protein